MLLTFAWNELSSYDGTNAKDATSGGVQTLQHPWDRAGQRGDPSLGGFERDAQPLGGPLDPNRDDGPVRCRESQTGIRRGLLQVPEREGSQNAFDARCRIARRVGCWNVRDAEWT
ncbi:MAG TPA: hypothetical protein PLF26_02870 [Blastocatellia bacterium]|nr:hypothetical protein [Blastocatellia bacterium]